MSCERHREIRRRRQRRKKIRKLRARLEQATTPAERAKVIARIRHISPNSPVPEE